MTREGCDGDAMENSRVTWMEVVADRGCEWRWIGTNNDVRRCRTMGHEHRCGWGREGPEKTRRQCDGFEKRAGMVSPCRRRASNRGKSMTESYRNAATSREGLDDLGDGECK
jgi:hypothetical protein